MCDQISPCANCKADRWKKILRESDTCENAMLRTTAELLVERGKGILCADLCSTELGALFDKIVTKNSEAQWRSYLEMLFSAAGNLEHQLSGVLVCEYTLRQATNSCERLVTLFQRRGLMAGIAIDKTAVRLAGTPDECTPEGLDNLAESLQQYHLEGCKFAMMRCAFRVSSHAPSIHAMSHNAQLLARFASICQQTGMVPIVETEVLADGAHNLTTSRDVAEEILTWLFKALADYHVYMEGMLLRMAFVRPGHSCRRTYTHAEIARATLEVLQRRVPTSIPGVLFLSGGLCEVDSAYLLNELNSIAGRRPWQLTFAYGRGLQTSALFLCCGRSKNATAAQLEFAKLAKANSQASLGQLLGFLETSFGREMHYDTL